MQIAVNEDLREISQEVVDSRKTDEEWSEIESDDMFQRPSIAGGFDATERAFCFSFYDDEGTEYWFQLTSDDLKLIAEGKLDYVSVRPAE